ncbi:MAG: hypothetical protein HYZ40_09770, partial [Rhodospirillales bacterium]|nr:hypothetical protein [Rhodospirillales bacterium]
ARGTELLKALHEEEYDRIIVVGHSLGAILAYDLVSYYWAMNLPSHTVEEGSQEFVVLRELEQLAADLAGNLDAATREKRINAWHDTRRCFCRLLRRRAKPMAKGEQDRRWLITDLITVGSPLGHADFLLAKDAEDRQLRIEERELAMSPPVREVLDLETIKLARAAGLPVGQELDPQTMELARKAGLPVREVLDPETIELARAAGLPVGERPALFSFPLKHHSEWQLHHAAQFAAVGWTNIHDPSIAVFLGDVVSAPAAPIFGPGVIDVNLRREQGQSLWFTHLDYWLDGEPTPTPLAQLRHALDLAAQRHP